VRIVNNTTGAQFWTGWDDYGTPRAYPTGGTNGYSGSSGGSGYGGAGGSGTMFSIITSYGEYFVALAGGGAGGGGGGVANVPPNVSQNANWCNQGFAITSYPAIVSGGDGEYLGMPNNGAGDIMIIGGNDGGGGAGGGGLVNIRQYVDVTAGGADKRWMYSGFGGRTSRGMWQGSDAWADGGESGKSGITSYATRYADVLHIPTTSRFPINPSNPIGLPGGILGTLNSYGHGGDTAIAGTNGVAYVDWGATSASVPTPTVSRAPIRASIIPYTNEYPPVYSVSNARGNFSRQISNVLTLTLDAFGGGGNPGTEYSYTWSSVSGGASIASPTSYRTAITLPSVVSTGVVRCTVSDGTTSATTDFNWAVVPDNPVYTYGGGA
jgi:hypothetical protein